MASTVFQQPQKIDVHIRNASLEEQTILTGKSSFPSRRSSIGIKVMSKFGLSQDLSPEYIAVSNNSSPSNPPPPLCYLLNCISISLSRHVYWKKESSITISWNKMLFFCLLNYKHLYHIYCKRNWNKIIILMHWYLQWTRWWAISSYLKTIEYNAIN